jgi:hypothetical protein
MARHMALLGRRYERRSQLLKSAMLERRRSCCGEAGSKATTSAAQSRRRELINRALVEAEHVVRRSSISRMTWRVDVNSRERARAAPLSISSATPPLGMATDQGGRLGERPRHMAELTGKSIPRREPRQPARPTARRNRCSAGIIAELPIFYRRPTGPRSRVWFSLRPDFGAAQYFPTSERMC